MSFLKKLFGRSRWEEAIDDPADLVPVWEAPGKTPGPTGGTGQAVGAAPPPRYAPGAAPGQEVGAAPGQEVGAAPPPRYAPGVAPGQEVGAGPEIPPTEVVLDTVAPDDLEMPEEFRGCAVVERRYPDGRSEVFYRGSDGFRVDEEAATILIEAYRAEVAERRRAEAVRPEARLYATPETLAPGAVEPRLGAGIRDLGGVAEEVIDELGFGEDLPPELRGAKLVRRGAEFRYLTRSGQRLSKDMAEGMMERWERDQAARARSLTEARRAPVAAVPPTPAAAARVPPAVGSGASTAPVSVSPATPAPASTPPPRRATAQPERTAPPSVVSADSIDAAIAAVAEVPAMAAAPAPTAPEPSQPEPSFEAARAGSGDATAVDIAAPEDLLARARRAADGLRALVLDDDPRVSRVGVTVERLKQACEAEISRRRTRHRFEHLAGLSQAATEALGAAWKGSADRPARDAARDLEQGMLVLGVFNPMTLREVDLAEFLSVVRLRGDARRRDIVTSELSRRVLEEVPPALWQFLMTRAFVDRSAEAAAEAGSVEQGLRRLMEDRLAEALSEILDEVMRRHGLWLPQLEERLLGRLRPLVDGLLRVALSQ